jgi:hypothetical protein
MRGERLSAEGEQLASVHFHDDGSMTLIATGNAAWLSAQQMDSLRNILNLRNTGTA